MNPLATKIINKNNLLKVKVHLNKIKIVTLIITFNKIVRMFKTTTREKFPREKNQKITNKIHLGQNNKSNKTKKLLKIKSKFKNKSLRIVGSRQDRIKDLKAQ